MFFNWAFFSYPAWNVSSYIFSSQWKVLAGILERRLQTNNLAVSDELRPLLDVMCVGAKRAKAQSEDNQMIAESVLIFLR